MVKQTNNNSIGWQSHKWSNKNKAAVAQRLGSRFRLLKHSWSCMLKSNAGEATALQHACANERRTDTDRSKGHAKRGHLSSARRPSHRHQTADWPHHTKDKPGEQKDAPPFVYATQRSTSPAPTCAAAWWEQEEMYRHVQLFWRFLQVLDCEKDLFFLLKKKFPLTSCETHLAYKTKQNPKKPFIEFNALFFRCCLLLSILHPTVFLNNSFGFISFVHWHAPIPFQLTRSSFWGQTIKRKKENTVCCERNETNAK